MRFVDTDGGSRDFIGLCRELDAYLNELVGGEENRAQYLPYNQLEGIHDVVLAYDGGRPVGCAGFQRYDGECAEVKRVYVRKEYRGLGISKEIMKRLEQKAKQKGYSFLILESGEPLVEAMALYRRIGFQVIPNYGQYQDMPESVCMKKKL